MRRHHSRTSRQRNRAPEIEPNRTAVETADGTVLEELKDPRRSFKSMPAGTPWSATQLVYFAGYAMSMYLTVPFSLLRDGIECQEVEPWVEDGETWRALKVTFPKSYVTHSTEQTIYFDGTRPSDRTRPDRVTRKNCPMCRRIPTGSRRTEIIYGHLSIR
jgi:hypothetical protein